MSPDGVGTSGGERGAGWAVPELPRFGWVLVPRDSLAGGGRSGGDSGSDDGCGLPREGGGRLMATWGAQECEPVFFVNLGATWSRLGVRDRGGTTRMVVGLVKHRPRDNCEQHHRIPRARAGCLTAGVLTGEGHSSRRDEVKNRFGRT